ncbi:hypothetical protein GCM10011575_00080 [Microlunatus endophyticus]|uniref:Uncharacterized protein n=1 Tax=Microlunatus endophyticus TaxID=1716077 RepID=A0A917RZ05_9ACTN|nr:hypothetical protein [Microlunatus endophyticus]GGL46124.1 hypothetical protein GCM10011575_00080 [Microlunatus endophyticus]
MQYITDQYGDPAKPWAHELSAGWYDNNGGWLQPGTTVVHGATGHPEPVFNGNQHNALQQALVQRPGANVDVHDNDVKDPEQLRAF